MIYTFIPFRTDKNLYRAYDDCMKLLKKNDYAVFLDHDVAIVDPDWFKKIEKGIQKTDGNLFTGLTNRIGCGWQVCSDAPSTNDIKQHREYVSKYSLYKHWIEDMTDEQLCGGFFFVIKKSWWEKIKKPEWDGMLLGLDNEIHKATREAGGKLLQLDIYFYHWYRGGDSKNQDHLL